MKAVIAMFGNHYLRSPNNIDIARLLQTGEQCGFPGMLGSIDCMHWKVEKLSYRVARYVYWSLS